MPVDIGSLPYMEADFDRFIEKVGNETRKRERIEKARKLAIERHFKLVLYPCKNRPNLFVVGYKGVWQGSLKNYGLFVKIKNGKVSFIRKANKQHTTIIFSRKNGNPYIYYSQYNKEYNQNKIRHANPYNIESTLCEMFSFNIKKGFIQANNSVIYQRIKDFILETLNDNFEKRNETSITDYCINLIYKSANFIDPQKLPPNFRCILRKENATIDDIVKYICGYTSKSVKKKIIEQLNHERFSLYWYHWKICRMIKKKVSVDYIYKLLNINDNPLRFPFPQHSPNLTDKNSIYNIFIKNNHSIKLISLLEKEGYETYNIVDTQRNLTLIRETNPEYNIFDYKFSSFRELHDIVARDANKIRNKEYDLFNEDLKELDGAKVTDSIYLTIPRTNHQLSDWAVELSNCMAGYASSVKNKTTSIIGVFYNKKLRYAIELKNKQIYQFCGRFNKMDQEGDIENKEIVTKFLEEKGFVETKHKRDALLFAREAVNILDNVAERV